MDHLEAKMAMVRGALAAGWRASAEVRLGDGAAVADVYAEDGRHRVALEAQWSRTTLDDLLSRQVRYDALGVRGAWFVRHGPIGVSKALPAFVLTSEGGLPTVSFAGRAHRLEAFITMLLTGRIQFRAEFRASGYTQLDIHRMVGTCERCGARAQLGLEVEIGPVMSACGRLLRPGGSWNAENEHPAWWLGVASPEVVSVLKSGGRSELPMVSAHQPGKPFLSLADGGGFCPSCGDGDVYRHRAIRERVVSEPIAPPDLRLAEAHWCLDSGQGHCADQ